MFPQLSSNKDLLGRKRLFLLPDIFPYNDMDILSPFSTWCFSRFNPSRLICELLHKCSATFSPLGLKAPLVSPLGWKSDKQLTDIVVKSEQGGIAAATYTGCIPFTLFLAVWAGPCKELFVMVPFI